MGQSSSTPAASTSGGASASATPPPGCPMHQQQQQQSPSSCPVDHSASSPAPWGQVNPVNNMPTLAQQPAPGQKTFLPLERTMSSIPRASRDDSAEPPPACPVAHGSSKDSKQPADANQQSSASANKWEYPSPQQFYNALVRKGWETPEESIEVMVNIHNWLNEEAWNQVRKWEEKHDGGDRSMLASFSGRPQDISPKARYHMFMGKLFPNTYASLKPFDRHDWIVHRPVLKDASAGYTAPSSTQQYTSHRYVIDYYALPDDSDGNPVFSLDVRPAVDDFASVRERVAAWYDAKKATWAGETSGATPGVRVQEER